MSRVSIIIPVYNGEKYLNRCIESAINQTVEDIEIVLINDGSTDASRKICDYYAKQNKHIKVIHQENQGVTAARRAGIENSESEFIYFLDADDSIENNTIETILSFVNPDVDIVVFESNSDIEYTMEQYGVDLFSFNNWNIWGKLFRKSLFDEYVLSVPKYFSIGEDFLMQLRILKNIQGKILLKKIHKYNYNINNSESVQKKFSYRTYEYESRMINEVCSIMDSLKDYDCISRSYFKWRITYLAGMTGLRYDIVYSDQWIKDLLTDKEKYKLSLKENLVLKSIRRPIFRVILILEKHVKLSIHTIYYFFR